MVTLEKSTPTLALAQEMEKKIPRRKIKAKI